MGAFPTAQTLPAVLAAACKPRPQIEHDLISFQAARAGATPGPLWFVGPWVESGWTNYAKNQQGSGREIDLCSFSLPSSDNFGSQKSSWHLRSNPHLSSFFHLHNRNTSLSFHCHQWRNLTLHTVLLEMEAHAAHQSPGVAYGALNSTAYTGICRSSATRCTQN